LPLQGKGGGLQPDFDAREIRNNVLERYPLDSMRMVGYLVLNKQPIAVIQADQLVKQVKIGDYMGLDFGVVTKISERELTLKEMIQDSTGEWTERVNTLPLLMKDGAK
jgi:type IV pilus assembly protein PilP